MTNRLPKCLVVILAAGVVSFSTAQASTSISSVGDSVIVVIPDTTVWPGQVIRLPIITSELPENVIMAFQFELNFGHNALRYKGTDTQGTISDVWGKPLVNDQDSSKIRIVAFGVSPLQGAGVLLWLNFQTKGQPGDTAKLYFSHFLFNAGSPVAVTDTSTIFIQSQSIRVHLQDYTATVGEEFEISLSTIDSSQTQIHSVAGNIIFDPDFLRATNVDTSGSCGIKWQSLFWEENGPNQINFVANAAESFLSSGKLFRIKFVALRETEKPTQIAVDEFSFNDGYPVAILDTTEVNIVPTIPVLFSFPDTIVHSGERAVLPLRMKRLAQREIYSFEFMLTFLGSVLNFVDVDTVETLVSNWPPPTVAQFGKNLIQVSAHGSAPITRDGHLVRLVFDVVGSRGDSTRMILANFLVNGGSLQMETQASGVGVVSRSYASEVHTPKPQDYQILPVLPNPFQNRTRIRMLLAERAKVRVQVYDILGRFIKGLANGDFASGSHDLVWRGENALGETVPAGVYFIRFEAKSFVRYQKILLLR